jgi:hypothetical protein
MSQNDDDAEYIKTLAKRHAEKALANDTEYLEALSKIKKAQARDGDPLGLPGGPETFQTQSCDKPPEDYEEEQSDTACKYLYNAIKESSSGILVGFKLKCHHPYMDRLPKMQEAVKAYESLVRVLLHLYSLRTEPDTTGECKVRFEACKQVAEELKEDWEGLLFHDPSARLDR